MNEIRVGLVGLGPRGRGCWARHFRQMPGYRLAAVCDRFTEQVEKTMREIDDPDVAAYRDFSSMLKEASPDAVGICSDPDRQVDLAVEALEAGVHVMTEVPTAFTMDDLWWLVTTVEKTGLVYQLGEQTRHWGFVDAWRGIVQSGAMGRIVCAEGQYIGYYGTHWFFYDIETGRYLPLDEARSNPRARPTWRRGMHPIWYLPHELSPLLKILDDRVVEVVAMGTPLEVARVPEANKRDMEIALMLTAKGTLMRLSCGFTCPVPHRGETGHHWYALMGTEGSVEWKRAGWDKCKMWTTAMGTRDNEPTAVEWSTYPLKSGEYGLESDDNISASGHGGADASVFATFRDAILNGAPVDMDVYKACETAAPAILAGESIDKDSARFIVPDFRPGPDRPVGQLPKKT